MPAPHLPCLVLVFFTSLALAIACGGSFPVPATANDPQDPVPLSTEQTEAMTDTIAIEGLSALEQRQADGGFVAYLPDRPVPTPIRAGDRLTLRLTMPDAAHAYALAVVKQAHWQKLWSEGPADHGGIRLPWPDGLNLSAEQAGMDRLLLVASVAPLPWLDSLTTADCSHLVGTMPTTPPQTVCEHLVGLFFGGVPAQIKGKVQPRIGWFWQAGTKLPATPAQNSGQGFTAIQFLYRPQS